MKRFLEKKNVKKLFDDSEKTGKQFVTIDNEDKWICVTHDGNEISLSIENWLKLVSLADELLIKTNNKQ